MIFCQRVTEQFIRNMRIDFRCADAGMAKHLLDGEQVGTTFKQVGSKTMSKSMRADGLGDAVLFRQLFHNEEDHLAREACATAVQKDGVGEFGLGRDVQPCAFNVLVEDFQAAVADRDEPFLAAFADDAQEAVFLVDIADLQSDEFRNTQAAAIHYLNHGFVAVASGLT